SLGLGGKGAVDVVADPIEAARVLLILSSLLVTDLAPALGDQIRKLADSAYTAIKGLFESAKDWWYEDAKIRLAVKGGAHKLASTYQRATMIRRLLKGWTGTEDENAILTILRDSTANQAREIFRHVPLSDIHADLHGRSATALKKQLATYADEDHRLAEIKSRAPKERFRNLWAALGGHEANNQTLNAESFMKRWIDLVLGSKYHRETIAGLPAALKTHGAFFQSEAPQASDDPKLNRLRHLSVIRFVNSASIYAKNTKDTRPLIDAATFFALAYLSETVGDPGFTPLAFAHLASIGSVRKNSEPNTGPLREFAASVRQTVGEWTWDPRRKTASKGGRTETAERAAQLIAPALTKTTQHQVYWQAMLNVLQSNQRHSLESVLHSVVKGYARTPEQIQHANAILRINVSGGALSSRTQSISVSQEVLKHLIVLNLPPEAGAFAKVIYRAVK
ncbi:MAG: hypothetical protein KC561_05615, partial [Myxococcales bacterium]|nr:hypothetical protein [Myxococcales bacterium]